MILKRKGRPRSGIKIVASILLLVSIVVMLGVCTLNGSQWSDAESNGWVNPLGQGKRLITSTAYDYDSAQYLKTWGARHTGIDISASPKSEVYSIAEGTVAKKTVSSPEKTVIIVKHTNSEQVEFFAIYGHVRARNGLEVGTEVGAGERIGSIVKSGSPSHLHFGINTSSLLSSFIFDNDDDHYGWGRLPAHDNLSTYNWVNPITYLASHTAHKDEGPSDVTLTLYVHENSTSGPTLAGVQVQVQGHDEDVSSFSQKTNSSGCVTITGSPGTWHFAASKSGYETNTWDQSITSTSTKHAYLTKQAPADVTLTLYVHEGSSSGPKLSGVRVAGHDGAGTHFDKKTNSSGYVTITGSPGTWHFAASKSGYRSNIWDQSTTSSTTRHAYIWR